MQGKKNLAAGFLFLTAFMVYGFVLIYLRDFAPGKEAWIADYAVGKHFESRLAHVHGNLFAFINIDVGYLLLRLPIGAFSARWISWLTLAGMLMPLGILSEVVFGLPPVLVLIGGVAMVASTVWFGIVAIGMKAAGTGEDQKQRVQSRRRRAAV